VKLKIAICTKHDLFGAIVLNHLIPSLSEHEIAVFFNDEIRSGESSVPELARFNLLERDLPLDTLFPLIEETGNVGELLTPLQMSQKYHFKTNSLRDLLPTGDGAILYAFEPDVIISVRFRLIFKQPIFSLPKFGIFNLHPGALPSYGGLFAPLRQMLSGAPALGCTFHRVDSGIDTGPIINIAWVPLRENLCLMQHTFELYLAGIPFILELVDNLVRNKVPVVTPQIADKRCYFNIPEAAEFSEFKKKGMKLTDKSAYRAMLSSFTPSTLQNQLDQLVDSAI
jgi:hypothetical protein